MNGLVWNQGCRTDSVESVDGHFRKDTPNFFCQSLVAIVMQGVGRVELIDRMGNPGGRVRLPFGGIDPLCDRSMIWAW